MLSTNNYDTGNIRLLKQVILMFVLICSVIQLFLSSSLNDVVNLILLVISNLVAINYCFNEKIFHKYPISLFMVFWSNFFSLGGALFFKTLQLEQVSLNLHLPQDTILFLTIANFIIILTHVIYTKINLFKKMSNYLNRLYFKLDIMNTKDNNFLYFCGAIAIGLKIFFWRPGISMYENIASACWFDPSGAGCGPSLGRDITYGFQIFLIMPFLSYISFYLFKKEQQSVKTIYILIFAIAIILISVSENVRSPMYDVAFKFFLIVLLMYFVGAIKINRDKMLKYSVIFVIIIYSFTYLETITRIYLIGRVTAIERSPTENLKSFFKDFKKSFTDRRALEKLDSMIEARLRAGINPIGKYYDFNLYKRLNVISYADDLNYASSLLNEYQRNQVIEFQGNKIISILPQPLINLFSKNFNKDKYTSKSVASYTYLVIQPNYGGFLDVGHSLIILKMFYGYFYFIFLIPLGIAGFLFFDSFYDSRNRKFSPIIIVYLYLTNGAVLNFFSTPSLDINIYIILRGIPQTIVLYLIMKKIYESIVVFKPR